MLPFYAENALILYHGDALSVLRNFSAESVDALITDPPYSSGAVTLSGKQASPASKYQQTGTKKTYPVMLGDCRDQRSFTLWMTLWLSECWRIAKPGAPALVFTDWRQPPCAVDAVQAAGFQKIHLTSKPVALLKALMEIVPGEVCVKTKSRFTTTSVDSIKHTQPLAQS